MTKETSKAIRNMGEKVSVSVTIYTAKIVRANFETMSFEEYTATRPSRKADLSPYEIAELFGVNAVAIKGTKSVSGKVYASLETLMKNGIFVPDSEDENNEE